MGGGRPHATAGSQCGFLAKVARQLQHAKSGLAGPGDHHRFGVVGAAVVNQHDLPRMRAATECVCQKRQQTGQVARLVAAGDDARYRRGLAPLGHGGLVAGGNGT